MAANFKIYRVDDIYILDSFAATQCFCNNILIFNTNGDVLKTFAHSDFSIDKNIINIKTSDNGQCMGSDYESHITEYNFIIENSILIEK